MKHSKMVYKNEKLAELKENTNMGNAPEPTEDMKYYRNTLPPQKFRVKAESIKHPSPSVTKVNDPFYKTQNMDY